MLFTAIQHGSSCRIFSYSMLNSHHMSLQFRVQLAKVIRCSLPLNFCLSGNSNPTRDASTANKKSSVKKFQPRNIFALIWEQVYYIPLNIHTLIHLFLSIWTFTGTYTQKNKFTFLFSHITTIKFSVLHSMTCTQQWPAEKKKHLLIPYSKC